MCVCGIGTDAGPQAQGKTQVAGPPDVLRRPGHGEGFGNLRVDVLQGLSRARERVRQGRWEGDGHMLSPLGRTEEQRPV